MTSGGVTIQHVGTFVDNKNENVRGHHEYGHLLVLNHWKGIYGQAAADIAIFLPSAVNMIFYTLFGTPNHQDLYSEARPEQFALECFRGGYQTNSGFSTGPHLSH